MKLIHARGAHRNERDSWNSLKLFLLYRLGVSIMLPALYLTSAIPFDSSGRGMQLFFVGSLLLVGANLMLVPVTFYGLMNFRRLVVSMVLLDIAVFTVLAHASTGLESGLPLLMIPSVAGASLLLPGMIAPSFAAFASLAVFLESALGYFFGSVSASTFTLAGLYGLILFAVAIIATKLARRARTSEAIAKQRDVDLADLAQLNTHIVEELETGVIVTADDGRVRLINQAAWRILGGPQLPRRIKLVDLSPALYAGMSHWRRTEGSEVQPFKSLSPTGADFEARFMRIGTGPQQSTLIFLADLSERGQQIQEIKLAALGRLTASIAHEIRNPLGAISHASQLLQESEALNDGDRHLADIIEKQTQRMNRLISSVLNLSRRKTPNTQQFSLNNWLQEVVSEYRQQYQLDEQQLQLESAASGAVRADPEQLHQVIWNLLDNAQSHNEETPNLVIQIKAGDDSQGRQAFIDIIDNGSGVPSEQADKLFEPFFTTREQGTGLGLFLAREICESNGGTLEYLTTEAGGSCFRIRIPAAGD
ncbi:MAG: sensor histidine kinase [Thiotrichales bacterium]